MMGTAAACRPEEPLELHWDEVCFIDYRAGNMACYEPKRRDLDLKPRRVPSHIRGSRSITVRLATNVTYSRAAAGIEKPLLVKGN